MTTVNGFRLHSSPGVETTKDGGIRDTFTIRTAVGAESVCRMSLPPYMVELVKAHADLDDVPGGESFRQALCGESLANYLWQNAEPPVGNAPVVDDMTSGLRHWVDAVLSATKRR